MIFANAAPRGLQGRREARERDATPLYRQRPSAITATDPASRLGLDRGVVLRFHGVYQCVYQAGHLSTPQTFAKGCKRGRAVMIEIDHAVSGEKTRSARGLAPFLWVAGRSLPIGLPGRQTEALTSELRFPPKAEDPLSVSQSTLKVLTRDRHQPGGRSVRA
jgi:hypothetical protein